MSATRLGRYDLLSEARAGRLTSVYRARLRATPRDVALKTLSPRATSEQAIAQAFHVLAREAEVRAAFDHPALLSLYDRFERAGHPVLVGPWLGGGTVWERWRERPPLSELVAFAEQVGEGLDALHARGWVHGDISPGNLLFDGDGRVRLADFGSCVPMGSRRLRGEDEPGGLRWGVTRLTAAPECWTGAPVDGRADLYAFGVVLYRLLTGRWPVDHEDPEVLVGLHLSGSFPAPSEAAPALNPSLDAPILAALDRDPARRPATGAALAASLRAAVAEARDPAPWLRPAVGPAAEAYPARAHRAREVLAKHLESRPADERAELETALAVLAQQDAQLRAEAGLQARRLLAPVAALLAAEELGVLHALAEAPDSTAGLAARLGLDAARLARLLRFLAVDDRVVAEGETWALASPWTGWYADTLDRASRREPLAEQTRRWVGLARWVRAGVGPVAMDADEAGHAYAASVGDLGDNAVPQAAALAGTLSEAGRVPDRAEILDIGAGSAVWSLALAAAWPEARVTAVDRPAVLEVARARARSMRLEARLATIAGSWQSCALPAGRFGLALLAKVCHLYAGPELALLFGRARSALRPEGRLVIVDTVPESLATADREVLRYDLALALRTRSGRIHGLDEVHDALAQAGLRLVERWSLSRSGTRLDVLVAEMAHAAPEPR